MTGWGVPHKPSGRFTVAHPGQACAQSSPVVPGQVPFLEGSSRSGNTEPRGRFSVETEAQAGGMDVEPSDGIPDLGSVWQAQVDLFASQESSQCPLWFSLSFPTTLGIDAFTHPWPNVSLYAFPPIKLIPAVLCRVKVSSARLLLIAPILALPDLVLGANYPLVSVPLGDSDQAGLAVPASGQDLASSTRALEVVGMAHTGRRAVIFYLSRFRRPSPVPEPPLLGSYTLPSGVSLNPGVWLVQ